MRREVRRTKWKSNAAGRQPLCDRKMEMRDNRKDFKHMEGKRSVVGGRGRKVEGGNEAKDKEGSRKIVGWEGTKRKG